MSKLTSVAERFRRWRYRKGWEARLACRRVRAGLLYATGRVGKGDALAMISHLEPIAESWTVVGIDSDYVLECMEDRYRDSTGALPDLVADACWYVAEQADYSDASIAARDWAEQHAIDEARRLGVPLIDLEDEEGES